MKQKGEANTKRDLIRLCEVDPTVVSDVKIFSMFLKKELELYKRKRKDYGPYPIAETGIVGLMVRILDKVHRVMHISKSGKTITVTDEQLKDTLMDLANYSNMALIELEHKKVEK